MKNLFFLKGRLTPYYTVLFVFSTVVIVSLQVFSTQWDPFMVVIDTVGSLAILFLFLLPIGYIIQFAGDSPLQAPKQFIMPLMASAVMVLIWTGLIILLMEASSIFSEDYMDFTKKTWVMRASVGFLLALVIFLMLQTFYLSNKRVEALERENQLKNLLQRTELQALKNQLNPHFIYNSLNSINSLTITSPEKAREMVGRLSDFLRYALNQDAMQLTTLENELKYIESYLNIEVVRFGERLKFDLKNNNEISKLQVPVMLLQPLFENAVKHGAQKSNQPVNIIFKTQVMENDVNLIVKNNFDKEFAKFRKEGVGLENVRNRLRLIYGNGNLLSLKSENDVFVATIRLPLKFVED